MGQKITPIVKVRKLKYNGSVVQSMTFTPSGGGSSSPVKTAHYNGTLVFGDVAGEPKYLWDQIHLSLSGHYETINKNWYRVTGSEVFSTGSITINSTIITNIGLSSSNPRVDFTFYTDTNACNVVINSYNFDIVIQTNEDIVPVLYYKICIGVGSMNYYTSDVIKQTNFSGTNKSYSIYVSNLTGVLANITNSDNSSKIDIRVIYCISDAELSPIPSYFN